MWRIEFKAGKRRNCEKPKLANLPIGIQVYETLFFRMLATKTCSSKAIYQKMVALSNLQPKITFLEKCQHQEITALSYAV